MPDEDVQIADDSTEASPEDSFLTIPQVEVSEEPAQDDGFVEVDPETEEKLKKAGIELETVDPTDAEDKEVVVEEPEAEKPVPEEVVEEQPKPEEQVQVFEQPEYIEIDGQQHKVEDVLKSRAEAANKIREQGQQVAQTQTLQNAFELIMRDPEGAKLVARLSSGQLTTQPQGPQIPSGGEEFGEWLGKDLPANLGAFVQQQNGSLLEEMRRQATVQNSILAQLEGQAIAEKHGDLEPLQPYLDQISQELGQNAHLMPQEMKILLAKGLKVDSDGAVESVEQKTKEDTLAIETKHREKVMAASVESASNVSTGSAKIIDFDSMTAKQKKEHLVRNMGARIAEQRD